MIIHMKHGANKNTSFFNLTVNYGVYFVEPVVLQKGRYIMANKMVCQLWKCKSEYDLYLYTINREYL